MKHIYGERWTDEKVLKGIVDVMTELELNRMPSSNEIVSVIGNASLSNAIKRRGGFYEWAERLGVDMKDSETNLGKEFERRIGRELGSMGYEVKLMSTKHPYDLLIDGNVKVDVKVGNLYESKNGDKFHTFNLEKKYATCDIYIAIALTDKEIDRVFIIPSKFLKKTQLSVGKESMYNKYIDRWDYVEKYKNLYRQII